MATNKKLDQHWQNIFTQQEKDFRTTNLTKVISKYITTDPIIDIGCGTGYQAIQLARQGFSVTGIDPSSDMLSMSKAYQKNQKEYLQPVAFKEMEIEEAASSYQHAFATALCLDVLEHIEDDRAAYHHIIQTVKPGGTIIVSVPAIPYLYGPKDIAIGHFRRYSKKTLQTLLQTESVDIKKIRYWNAIGVVPTLLSTKVLKKPINESFRYERRDTNSGTILNTLLRKWFSLAENSLHPPFGLSLIAVLSKL